MEEIGILKTVVTGAISFLFALMMWDRRDRKLEIDKLHSRVEALERFDAKIAAYLEVQKELSTDLREVRDAVIGLKAVLGNRDEG